EAAARAKCSNNMKQLGLAIHNFHGTFDRLPPAPGTIFHTDYPSTSPFYDWAEFTQYRGWMCEILPYIEQDNLYRVLYTVPWYNGFFANQDKAVPTYQCPSDVRNVGKGTNGNGAPTSYLGVTGNDGNLNAEYGYT